MAIFQIPKHDSKCALYFRIDGNSFKSSHYEIPRRNFHAKFGNRHRTNLAPLLATYIYGNARRKYILYAHIKILFGLKCLKDSWVTDSGSLKATKNNFQRGLMNLTICEKIFF